MTVISLLCCITYGQESTTPTTTVAPEHLDQKYKLGAGSVIYNSQNQSKLVTAKTKFNLVDQTGDSLFIRLINDDNIPDSTDVDDGLVNSDLSSDALFYLLQGSKQAFKYSFSDWDIEPLTIPIKIRPSIDTIPLQFTPDVALGAYIGYQFGNKSYYDEAYHTTAFTICAFVAPSYISVSPSTASTTSTTGSNSVFGLSTGMGLLYDLDSFQIGLVSGVDFVGGSLSESWAYQGKPWFSISFSFDVDSTEN